MLDAQASKPEESDAGKRHVPGGRRVTVVPSLKSSVKRSYKIFDGPKVRSYDLAMATWDESKRQTNLRNHGLDFAGCEAVFDSPVFTWDDDREAYGELRINLLGWLKGVVVHMTYTERSGDLHIISLRKAEKHEIRRYIAEISR